MKFIIILILFSYSLCSFAQEHKRNLWVWSNEDYYQGSVIFDDNEQERLIKTIRSYDISTIYLDVQQIVESERAKKPLEDFIIKLNQMGVKVEYLLGHPGWSQTENYHLLKEKVSKVISFSKDFNLPKNVATIHLDIEPQALKAWLDPDQRHILQVEYLENIKKIAKYIKTKDHLISIDAGFYYDQYKIGALLDKNLALELMKVVDHYIMMTYRDNAQDVINLAQEEIAFKKNYHLPVAIYMAIETNPNKNYGKVTLYEEGKRGLELLLQGLDKKKERLQLVRGIVIHDYQGLLRLNE